ncbi:hypothetical protein [Mycolicibacterium austroafricanum]|uniref:hypothetical protein n=1 Tax=Mycolicibacterium austroafricanum TaxID=39687 RepID=UPI001CA31F6C|nr:hypothetical protein [Mycolicibacterium austroafricanum]QZT61746.1 hypothetical protein JN085_22790 [Mycolicibacterium austroafricanum]
MPTSTDHDAPAHDAPSRALFSARASAVAIVVAAIATLGVVFVMLNAGDKEPPQVKSIPAQPNTVSQWVTAPARDKPIPVTPSPQAPALAMDGRGFVNTAARCDAAERAVAIARTARSAVVVCQGPDGSYEYQGIRLRDGAALQLDDVRPMAVGFEARNEGTTYRLSPTELVVISGETLQSRDAVVEYRAG